MVASKPKSKRPPGNRQRQKSVDGQYWKPILGDLLATFVWCTVSSIFAEAADYITEASGIDVFTANVVILVLGLIAFAPVCSLLWGAVWNPLNSLALIITKKGPAGQNAWRMVGQLVGAVAGSTTATMLIPHHYQGKFHLLSGGLRSNIPLAYGFACEALLGFALNILFLYSLDASNKTLAYWAPLAGTVGMCYIGAEFTGPTINPVLAFSWNWHYQKHTTEEHIMVFWIAPVIGAIAAAVMYRTGSTDSTTRRTRSKKKTQ